MSDRKVTLLVCGVAVLAFALGVTSVVDVRRVGSVVGGHADHSDASPPVVRVVSPPAQPAAPVVAPVYAYPLPAARAAVIGYPGVVDPVAKDIPLADDTEFLARWNAVAASRGPFELYYGGEQIHREHFAWAPGQPFPHPTFRGGSSAAYTAFARQLVQFYRAVDNEDWVRRTRRMDRPIESWAVRRGTATTATLRALTRYMAHSSMVDDGDWRGELDMLARR